jgi:hypothetical protein
VLRRERPAKKDAINKRAQKLTVGKEVYKPRKRGIRRDDSRGGEGIHMPSRKPQTTARANTKACVAIPAEKATHSRK